MYVLSFHGLTSFVLSVHGTYSSAVRMVQFDEYYYYCTLPCMCIYKVVFVSLVYGSKEEDTG